MDISATEELPAQHFEYQKLDQPRQIRLLRAFPDPKRAGQIQCKFICVDLDHLPRDYVAISYCWGDPAMPETVRVGSNRYLSTTRSAMSTLSAILAQNPMSCFWDDGLCINQTGNDEKGQQVRLMREIYASAESVIVWLGESTTYTNEAIDFIPTLLNAVETLQENYQPITEDALTQFPSCETPSTRWVALNHFLQNPLFELVWIIQEIVAASRATLMCREGELDWDSIARLLRILSENDLYHSLAEHPHGNSLDFPAAGFRTIYIIHEIRKCNKSASPPTLDYCLVHCGLFKASDPRDKLFAMIGIAANARHEDLDPDYNESPQRLFTKWAGHLVTRQPVEMSILHVAGVGFSRTLPGLPFWVPDWTSIARAVLGAHSNTTYYNAGGNFTAGNCPRFDADLNIVTVRGHIVDPIHGIRQLEPDTIRTRDQKPEKQRLHDIVDWFTSTSDLISSDGVYPTREPVFPAVGARTNIGNALHKATLADKQYVESFSAYSELLRRAGVEDDTDYNDFCYQGKVATSRELYYRIQ